MKIKSIEFAGAIGRVGQAGPESVEGLPQVAFAGRSNVGKSSLINRVLGRTRTPIARVSQQPGKTQEINFYRVIGDVGDFCLVDFPGYGYARVPHAIREKWQPLINSFLTSATRLSGVVQLIDMRHGPTPDDLQAVDYLAELEIPVLFVLTKADKLTATQRQAALAKIPAELAVDVDQVLPVSALSGLGIEDLLQTLGSLLFPPEAPEETGEAG
jgi:GTP-binding protein